MSYSIIPLNVGDFEALPKQTCMYRMYREVTYKAPCIMWYLKGTKNNIVVDLGPADPDQCLKNHGFVIKKDKKQNPAAALESIGVSADDVKIAIVTHLHWDHSWGFHFFKNARFLVQKKEMEFAIAPLPCHRSIYYEQSEGKPTFVDYLDRVDIIEGDKEIEKGVEAVFIPGHSTGFQGVSVQTGKGKYLIAGDAVGLFECWERDPHVPSGLFVNLEVYYESMAKIDRVADFVLPGHDGKVFDKPSYP